MIDKIEYNICDVCGKSEKETKITYYGAMGLPVSFGYCENCDKEEYLTDVELILYLSNPKRKQEIIENIDFIIENCQAICQRFPGNNHTL